MPAFVTVPTKLDFNRQIANATSVCRFGLPTFTHVCVLVDRRSVPTSHAQNYTGICPIVPESDRVRQTRSRYYTVVFSESLAGTGMLPDCHQLASSLKSFAESKELSDYPRFNGRDD
jgi:hypothetical protein